MITARVLLKRATAIITTHLVVFIVCMISRHLSHVVLLLHLCYDFIGVVLRLLINDDPRLEQIHLGENAIIHAASPRCSLLRWAAIQFA